MAPSIKLLVTMQSADILLANGVYKSKTSQTESCSVNG